MRNAFLDTLFELAQQDSRIVFITGDLGYRVVEKFMEQRPLQFLNAGVAEQNMTSLAAGMALSGKIVFTYSIGNFPTMRCLEQIRNDVCYHEANVKIVTVGGGFAYGPMGVTHHAIEDLAVMRAIPGLTIVAPGDPVEARAATRAITALAGPCYLRLGKAGEPTVHTNPIDFQLGKAIRFREGKDLTLICTGGMLQTAAKAAERLAGQGLQTRVLSMHTLKPLDEAAVLAAARETACIATLEEHSINGGLGSAVAEVLAEAAGIKVPFKRLGMPPIFSPHIGSQEYMLQQHGLNEESVSNALKTLCQQRR
ncbi:MAG TPA: transketolase C-terminal domain-containing protein [Verrucomicrobiae bacterium]|nr:transketolase C-terminal domain-containing protein [Verrucomicrobiae bacterium]